MKVSVNIKMDEDVRNQAKELFNKMGLDMTTAVNIFLIQSIREQKIPFQISTVKNEMTEEEIEKLIAKKLQEAEADIDNGRVKEYSNLQEDVKKKLSLWVLFLELHYHMKCLIKKFPRNPSFSDFFYLLVHNNKKDW